MSDKEYFKELAKVRANRLNEITRAVNNKVPEAQAGLKNEIERRYYGSLWKQAEAIQEKHGKWPVFEMAEIESDDPALDIYNS